MVGVFFSSTVKLEPLGSIDLSATERPLLVRTGNGSGSAGFHEEVKIQSQHFNDIHTGTSAANPGYPHV